MLKQLIFSSNHLIGFSPFKIGMITWVGFCLKHTFSIVAVQSSAAGYFWMGLIFSFSECIGCTIKLSSVHFLPKQYFLYS